MFTKIQLTDIVIVYSDEEKWLVTIFPDGVELPAAPNYDTDNINRAIDLGYNGDTWAMSRDHEISHTWLAPNHLSYTLDRVAHEVGMDLDIVHQEECDVLEFQRNLDKNAAPPWSKYIM